jgi:hypothetical protein
MAAEQALIPIAAGMWGKEFFHVLLWKSKIS